MANKILQNLNMSIIFITGGNAISGIIFFMAGKKNDNVWLMLAGALLFAAGIGFIFVANHFKKKIQNRLKDIDETK